MTNSTEGASLKNTERTNIELQQQHTDTDTLKYLAVLPYTISKLFGTISVYVTIQHKMSLDGFIVFLCEVQNLVYSTATPSPSHAKCAIKKLNKKMLHV